MAHRRDSAPMSEIRVPLYVLWHGNATPGFTVYGRTFVVPRGVWRIVLELVSLGSPEPRVRFAREGVRLGAMPPHQGYLHCVNDGPVPDSATEWMLQATNEVHAFVALGVSIAVEPLDSRVDVRLRHAEPAVVFSPEAASLVR